MIIMNIVAIGGGNKTPIMAEAFLRLDSPNVLIIPSACSTEKSYDKKVAACEQFFNGFGLRYVTLHKLDETPSATKLDEEFGKAHLLYVIGGNSPHMMKTLKEHGSDDAIRTAVARRVTLAGTSAGAILPFQLAHSNPAKKPAEEIWDYEFIDALGIIPAAVTAHADQHDPSPNGLRPDSRFDHFQANFPETIQMGFAIQNGAALVINGSEARVSRSNPDAQIHIVEPAGTQLAADNAQLTAALRQINAI